MSCDIVIFKIVFLGNIFGDFPKFRVLENIDFTGFPNLFPEMNENEKPKNIFGEMGKAFLGKIYHFRETFFIFGKCNFGKKEFIFVKIATKNRRCLCEK